MDWKDLLIGEFLVGGVIGGLVGAFVWSIIEALAPGPGLWLTFLRRRLTKRDAEYVAGKEE